MLGADRRLTPVYAVLDESVLTIDDFQNAIDGENTNDVATFTAGMIARSLDPNPDLTLTPPGGGFNTDMYKDITTTSVLEYLPPLLNTKWGQEEIFNDKFPDNDDGVDGKQSAGCATIALAQILNYHSYPSPIVLDGHTFYWRDINQFTWDNDAVLADPVLVDKMSNYIYRLAQDLDVTYNSNGSTGASIQDARRVMRQQDYDNLSIGAITRSRIYPMLYNNRPVYARGSELPNQGGHVWVIDGWKKVQINHILITYDGFGVEKSRRLLSSTEADYVHCNMGYYGECDGYYNLDLYDLTRSRLTDGYERAYGDSLLVNSAEFSDYAYDLESLTYDF